MKYVFVVILLLLGVASIATWLTEPAQQQTRPIMYWKSDPNPQRFEQIELFHRWLVEHGYTNESGDAVVELRLDAANNQSSLIQAVSGVGGDIIDYGPPAFGRMGLAEDLTEIAQEGKFGLDQTYPGLASALSYQGRQYGYPCNANVVALWCNLDAFEKAGMGAPPEIWDPETFECIGRDYMKTVTRPGEKRTHYFCNNPLSEWTAVRWITSMLRSRGEDIMNETLTRVTIGESDVYREILERFHKWIYEYHLMPSASDEASLNTEAGGYGGGGLTMFGEGRYAMFVTGRWCLIRLREFDKPPRLSVSRFPMWEYPNMMISARSAVLYRGSRNKRYASLFFSFLADQSYNDYVAGFADALPPNPRMVAGSPHFRPTEKYPNEGDVSLRPITWANTIALPEPFSPFYTTGNDWECYGRERYFNGLATAEEAVAEIGRRMNDEISMTVAKNEDLQVAFAEAQKHQGEIDRRKQAGERLPRAWITNPFYLKYYAEKGMLEEMGHE